MARSGKHSRFRDRAEAGTSLAEKLDVASLVNPIVVAIAKGGVLTGGAVAKALRAELDVALCVKLRAAGDPEETIGAVCSDGSVYFNDAEADQLSISDQHIHEECLHRMHELQQRLRFYRSLRPEVEIAGRSVIVVDDGVLSGLTMISVVRWLRTKLPLELIIAVPVAPDSQVRLLRSYCDRLICLNTPETMFSIGQFYDSYPEVDDAQALHVLTHCHPAEIASTWKDERP